MQSQSSELKDPTKNIIYFQIQNSLNINPHFCHHSVYTGNLIQANKIEKQLYFSFLIKPLQSIRLLSQNNKTIIALTLGDLRLSVKGIKNSHQFIYEQGLYRNYLVAQLTFGELPALEVGRKQIKIEQQNSLVITLQKTIKFDEKNKWILQDCIPTLQVGNIKPQKILQCKIRAIYLSIQKNVQKLTQATKKQRKMLIDGPLDTIPKTQIPDIKSLPEYVSPAPKLGRLYLCHDMAGGYHQDMNKNNPFPQQHNRYKMGQDFKHTYRSLHLAQTDIFNYFSHHLITIPPKHWRRQCKAAKTKCLGTYIVQGEYPAEDEYLSDYTIKMLVYFCKKYKFDGYLINFEKNIKNAIKLLIPWLRRLVEQLHAAVPGAQIIWYDAVIRNGKVSYQNQINDDNQIFYKICDGMFLNYWWNQQKLNNTLNYKIDNKIIYVGSDCFGRGTFGGGKFDTYKAVNTIKQINSNHNILAPALFAMGYTYETQKYNIQAWKLHEKFLYRGMSFSKFPVPHLQWEYFNNNVNGFKWQIGNEWATTSFQQCKRFFSVKLKNLLKDQAVGSAIIHFFTTVVGTGPNFADSYRVTMVISLATVPIKDVSTGNQLASQAQKIVEVKLEIDAQLITQQTVVTIIQEGHDAEKWGGHFGSSFKNDHLYVTKYTKQNDWVGRIRTNYSDGVELPFVNYYNLGHGNYFYLKGHKVKKSYDFMSDSDINYAYLMNPPMHVGIYYDDAYIGGTCLLVERYNKLKVIEVDVKNKENLTKTKNICCRMTLKNLQEKPKFNLIYKLGQQQSNAKLQTQKEVQNGWISYSFIIDGTQIKAQHDKMVIYLESRNQTCKYLLGQTAIYPDTHTIPKNKIDSLELTISDHNPPIAPVFFNADIQMDSSCKIMFEFGEQFVCFGHADNFNSNSICIRNIHNKVNAKNNTLKIYIINDKLELSQIYQKFIDSKKLMKDQTLKLI